MKSSILIIAATACLLQAQDANAISANEKQSWNNIRNLLTKEAAKMPEDNYKFKPVSEIQDFGARVAHIVTSNKGEQKTVSLTATSSKADIAAAMKEAWDECDSVFNSLTDADLHKMIAGRGGQRPELAVIQGMLEHSQEMYGYMAVYLRLKGVVPPSSDRNEP